MKELVQALAITMKVLAGPLGSESEKDFKNHLGPLILRFPAFRSLDITHTCLHNSRNIETEKIPEVHDKEKLSMLKLGDLLAILQQSERSGLSLSEF